MAQEQEPEEVVSEKVVFGRRGNF